MAKLIRARTTWINLYLKTKDAGLVCRKSGICRPTLRKGYRRYLADGIQGLIDQSKKPHSSPNQTLNYSSHQFVRLCLQDLVNRDGLKLKIDVQDAA